MEQRQPIALYFLFLTEMWERFGFYIVQGLLILYITEFFNFSDSASYTILGTFTALAYISPIIGGYVANKFLGYENSILWGGFFLILGYVLLSIPFFPLVFFYIGLGSIIVGNGLFKPNISSLLGTQYTSNDSRRDSGFTIFYIGINIGALLAGLSAGYIKEYFGWKISFLTASIGLFIGVITFLFGRRALLNRQRYITPFKFKAQFFFYCIVALVCFNFLLRLDIADWLLPGLGIVLLVYLVYLTSIQEAVFRKRMFILNLLIVSSIVFWMFFLQIFYSANLFVERLVDKDILDIHLTSTLFWGSEAVFIVLFGPFFAWLWHKLSQKKLNPSPVLKFSFGIIMLGIGFLILGTSTMFPNAENLIPPYWVFISYLAITIGELLLSPIGLSAVTILAPPNLVGLMMGIWFVATGFGGIFAGVVAKVASVPDSMTETTEKLLIYQHAFFDYAYFALFIGILLFLIHIALTRFLIKDSLTQ